MPVVHSQSVTVLQLLINCLSMQKTIRHSKVGTLSKKMKAPEISDADKLKAAIEVRKNTIKINITDLWKRVQVRM